MIRYETSGSGDCGKPCAPTSTIPLKPRRAIWPRWVLKIVCVTIDIWIFGWFEFSHGAQYGVNACMMILIDHQGT